MGRVRARGRARRATRWPLLALVVGMGVVGAQCDLGPLLSRGDGADAPPPTEVAGAIESAVPHSVGAAALDTPAAASGSAVVPTAPSTVPPTAAHPPDEAVSLGDVAVALHATEQQRRAAEGRPPEATPPADPLGWMVRLGLLTGMPSRPATADLVLTRGDLAVVLHRFAGSPLVGGMIFDSVQEPTDPAAMAWLRGSGLAAGTALEDDHPDRVVTWADLGPVLERLVDAPLVRVAGRVAGTIVDDRDLPDPFIVPVDDGYLMFTTQGNYTNVPLYRSDDLVTWTYLGDVLPELPGWAEWGRTWAPDVVERGGRWYLLFTARHAAEHNQCIGRAVADSPLGPFVADAAPLVCQHERGGAIDPRVFTDDDGHSYLYWKSDDNHRSREVETVLWAQQIDEEIRFIGPRVRLVGSDDAPFLGPIIESPQMVRVDDGYVLTFSAGRGFYFPDQFIATARCDGPVGPCVPSPVPLVASSDDGPGPGEHSLFRDHDGVLRVAYAPWHAGHAYLGRALAMAEVQEGDDGLSVVPPDDGA